MPNNIFINANKTMRPSDVGDKIRSRELLDKATRENPVLTIALADASRRIAEENRFSNELLEELLETEPELKTAASDRRFREELSGFLKDSLVERPPSTRPERPGGGRTPADETEDEKNAGLTEQNRRELMERLLVLLKDLELARPGDIITSEHHNSLVRVARLIAELLEERTETFTLTFAPLLLPLGRTRLRLDAVVDARGWEISFNRAGVPTEGGGLVAGALLVGLPDEALIKSVIVRGQRVGESGRAPKNFTVTLAALELNKTDAAPKPLVEIDLAEEKDDFIVRQAPKNKDLRVENEKFAYAVFAVWEGTESATRFELNALQITCER